jgi:hypothetical protein
VPTFGETPRITSRLASRTVRRFANTLSVAPLTHSLRRDHADFVVLCFARPEDAETFAGCFGGKTMVEKREKRRSELLPSLTKKVRVGEGYSKRGNPLAP